MRVLVTGGAGFIGSHSVEMLLSQGAEVVVLDDLSSGRAENLPRISSVSLHVGDIRDAAAVAAAMQGAHAVLHLAAQVSVQASIDDPAHSCSINVDGFVTVLDCARRLGVRRFVYASSAAVYGEPSQLPLTEASPTQPLSPYGLEKLVNDQYAALYAAQLGLSCLGLRYFNVFGPRQDPSSPYAGVISRFVDRLRAGQPLTVFGDGEQSRDFIYVGDVAAANAAALSSGVTGLCNVATGQRISLNQLIETLHAASGRRTEVRFAAERGGDIRHSGASGERLRQELRFSPRWSLREGLAALWRETA